MPGKTIGSLIELVNPEAHADCEFYTPGLDAGVGYCSAVGTLCPAMLLRDGVMIESFFRRNGHAISAIPLGKPCIVSPDTALAFKQGEIPDCVVLTTGVDEQGQSQSAAINAALLDQAIIGVRGYGEGWEQVGQAKNLTILPSR